MCKDNYATIVSVRVPDNLLLALENWCKVHNVSRSAAINYLLTKGLISENGVPEESR